MSFVPQDQSERDLAVEGLNSSTLIAAENMNRKAFGFEIKKEFYHKATKWINDNKCKKEEIEELGYAKSELSKSYPILF
jgi:DNA modification methylase